MVPPECTDLAELSADGLRGTARWESSAKADGASRVYIPRRFERRWPEGTQRREMGAKADGHAGAWHYSLNNRQEGAINELDTDRTPQAGSLMYMTAEM